MTARRSLLITVLAALVGAVVVSGSVSSRAKPESGHAAARTPASPAGVCDCGLAGRQRAGFFRAFRRIHEDRLGA